MLGNTLKEHHSVEEQNLRNQCNNLENAYRNLEEIHIQNQKRFDARETELQEQCIADLCALNMSWKEKLINAEESHLAKMEESNANHLQFVNRLKHQNKFKVIHLKHHNEIELSIARSESTYNVEKERNEHRESICMLSDKIDILDFSRMDVMKELDKIKNEKEVVEEDLSQRTIECEMIEQELCSLIIKYKSTENTLRSENSSIRKKLHESETKSNVLERKVCAELF